MKTILLVEDTPDLMDMMRQLLEANSYRVLYATDGTQALERLRTAPGKIDVLVTDLNLPDMGGADVAAWGTRMHRQMKVLFISGAGRRASAPLPQDSVLLQKPFPGKELLRVVADLAGQ